MLKIEEFILIKYKQNKNLNDSEVVLAYATRRDNMQIIYLPFNESVSIKEAYKVSKSLNKKGKL